MEQLTGHLLSVFMGFFAIMNPIANTPIFLGLTAGDPRDVRRNVAAKSLLIAFVLVVAFVLLGKVIFNLFGITLPAFQIMGGGLVGLIGYQMMHGQQSKVHQPSSDEREASLEAVLSVAVTPLAIPILAGPGTIATAMNYASTGGFLEMITTIAAFAVLCFITYVFFVYGERLIQYLGQAGLTVVTRLMGLVLGVIGVQMLITGVTGAVGAYQGTLPK
jgi:multiple antibiotic resistance protein